jgi:hypothetical protein
MKLREFFLGKPLHWAILAAMTGALAWIGHAKLHVRFFNQFSFAVFGMTAAVLLFIILSHRRGEQVTREPLDEDRDPDDTGSADEAGQ